MRLSDSTQGNFLARAEPDTDEYKHAVAEPTMRAVDAMPPLWRAAVGQYGYVDVYRAWSRGWMLDDVCERAEANGGVFVL